MTSEKYYAGFDAGTQSVKVVICNEVMECVASASLPTTLYYPNPGWVEMDVDEYLNLTLQCLKSCADQMKDKGLCVENIQSIMGDGIICGIAGVDADGNAITPYINYLDSRTEADVRKINEMNLDIWGKETAFEYDNKNTLIHKSEMIGGQVWNDYDYNESEKLLYFKDIWGKERVFECDDRDILKSDDLDYQTNKDTFSGNIKILFSKDKWGEYKYEYDEKGGYTKYVLNKNGEFEVECCDNDSCDENEVIIEDLDLDW